MIGIFYICTGDIIIALFMKLLHTCDRKELLQGTGDEQSAGR